MSQILIKENSKNFVLKDIHKIIDFEKFMKRIMIKRGESLANYTVKIEKDGRIKCFKSFNNEVLKFLISNKEHFVYEEVQFLKENLETSKKSDAAILCHIELILLLKLYNEKIVDLKTFYDYALKLEYIPDDVLNQIKHQIYTKKTVNKNSFKKNTNILRTNKNSYEFPRDYDSLRNIKIRTLLQSLNLPLVEVPVNKDSENVVSFLRDASKLKRELNLKKFNFSLRIKKTGKKKKGMFVVNANTMIVDPRYPEVFVHELGHYIYEHKLAFTFNEKRYYPSLFHTEINKFRKNNDFEIKRESIEDYSDDSEVFALWFENLINYRK